MLRCLAPATHLRMEIMEMTTKTLKTRPGEARAWLENYLATFHTARPARLREPLVASARQLRPRTIPP